MVPHMALLGAHSLAIPLMGGVQQFSSARQPLPISTTPGQRVYSSGEGAGHTRQPCTKPHGCKEIQPPGPSVQSAGSPIQLHMRTCSATHSRLHRLTVRDSLVADRSGDWPPAKPT
ncbi:hypothetical protein NDU88_005910 [Pleurodeles waltl]|uniref:Uncharacterized protein n=1 Tax=Pleurodeles waltl TaxID=8319 RepID=A0AAV7TVP0_PLEWA|nr:hypothetical protein NDU88_005910 [Pleurodeles waltl]